MSWKRRSGRIKPLLNIRGTWKTGSSYPDTLAVAMRDGRVIYYSRMVQPARIYVGENRLPVIGKVVVGYQYKKSPLKKVTGFFQRRLTW